MDNKYLLELNDEGYITNIKPDEILNIPKNSNLKIKIPNGGKICKNIQLITNANNLSLNFQSFTEGNSDDNILKLHPTEINSYLIFVINLKLSGPVFFTFMYTDINTLTIKHTREFYILVDPILTINSKTISLDSIQIQTILSKSLGKVADWEKLYNEAKSLNYNFIHFTPIQKLGLSESLYCISDNNEISNTFFTNEDVSNVEKMKIIEQSILLLKNIYHIGAIVDIVLNHCATNSKWLIENPESGFNLINSPHLNCAYELDKLLLEYSQKYADKKVSCISAPYIYNEKDLTELISDLSKEIYKQNFEEFFIIPIDKYVDEFKKFFILYKKELINFLSKKAFLFDQLIIKGRIPIDIKNKNDTLIYNLIFDSCLNYGSARYGVIINVEFISLLTLQYLSDNPTELEFLKAIKSYLNKINDFWYKKAKEFLSHSLENIRSYIKYEFLDLKRFKVTNTKRIVDNYFINYDKDNKQLTFACNGWLFGVNDPTINFAHYGNWHYFNRSIVVWGDCAKLNYGKDCKDSPYLWEHMTKYVQDMARIFNGFRLDNAHSTPIHVAEYLITKAREVNPDLLIVAELFAGSKEREINFVNMIGINHLIREAIYCSDGNELSEKIHKYGGGFNSALGMLNQSFKEYSVIAGCVNKVNCTEFNYLIPSKPRSIIYDITHDNPTFYEKFNNLELGLTFLSVVGMAKCSIGSTRGTDQLFPYQPSVVNENRLYQYDENFSRLVNSLNDEGTVSHEKISFYRNHTFEFNLDSFPNIKTNSVRLAISSNDWKPNIFLTKINDKIFTVTLELLNDLHYYKYVVDGDQWIHDHSKDSVKDDYGNVNNSLDLRWGVTFNQTDLKIMRREVNKIRDDLCAKINNQFYLHHDKDLICIFRMFSEINDSDTDFNYYDGYALISNTGFKNYSSTKYKVELPGEISEFICMAKLSNPNFDINIIRSDTHLIGVNSNLHFTRDIKSLTAIAGITNKDNKTLIEFNSLSSNTVIILKLKHSLNTKKAINNILNTVKYLNRKGEELIDDLNLCDFNQALYKCDKEEMDNTMNSRGNYEIKNYGKLVYAGISHLHQLIQDLKIGQILDHDLFDNVREGNWLINYQINRLKESPTLLNLFRFLKENVLNYFDDIKNYQKPFILSITIDSLFHVLKKKLLWEILVNNINKKFYEKFLNEQFIQNLFISGIQFLGYVESSKFKSHKLTMAAGLPHFSTEYMRCWGRDTFISFKGLLLIPGYYNEAKQILRNYSSCLRHGLIPNLLDGGHNPRYNSRDSVWFFLNALKEYITMTEDYNFLNDMIQMNFLDDDIRIHYEKLSMGESKIMKISEIIFHILDSHAKGIEFQEWGAGKSIDEHMKDEGFNIKIYLDKSSGFIYGGNSFNCGTWMDKMGSSAKANNKGVPATPRDGANIEIIGILFSILQFVNKLNTNYPEYFPYRGIRFTDNPDFIFSFFEWSLLIKDHFEKNFFVNSTQYTYAKRNIYKDYLSHSYDLNNKTNFQLRPNFLISMAISPDLFTFENARKALSLVENFLIVQNGLGIRTLDYEDEFYNGDYHNSDDSINYHTAHGFNYHNGPEWIWPIGYYIMAKMNFSIDEDDLDRHIYSILNAHEKYIKHDIWRGLPELRNTNNSDSPGSCNTQAWSIATVLECLYQYHIKKNLDK